MVIWLVGTVIGLVLGLTGAGGSVLAVPLLMILLSLPMQKAAGLALGAVASSALFGVVTRARDPDVRWLPALTFAAFGVVTAPVGVFINQYIPELLLMAVFSALVLYIARRMWRQATMNPQLSLAVRARTAVAINREDPEYSACSPKHEMTRPKTPPTRAVVACVAAGIGFLSGIFGVGGGFMIVPALLWLWHFSPQQAVGTSLLVIALVSTSGFASFVWTNPDVNRDLLFLLASGGMVGMILGILTSKRLAGPTLQKVLSLAMVGVVLLSVLKRMLA